jgi:hypothetical protein
LLLHAWYAVCQDRKSQSSHAIDKAGADFLMPVLEDYHKRGELQWGDSIEKKRLADPQFRNDYDAALGKAVKQVAYEEATWLMAEPSLEAEFRQLKAAVVRARN